MFCDLDDFNNRVIRVHIYIYIYIYTYELDDIIKILCLCFVVLSDT